MLKILYRTCIETSLVLEVTPNCNRVQGKEMYSFIAKQCHNLKRLNLGILKDNIPLNLFEFILILLLCIIMPHPLLHYWELWGLYISSTSL